MSGFAARFQLYTKSFAVRSVPSDHFVCFSLMVHWVPSSEICGSPSAIAGVSLSSLSYVYRPTKELTARQAPSTVLFRAGSRCCGSDARLMYSVLASEFSFALEGALSPLLPPAASLPVLVAAAAFEPETALPPSLREPAFPHAPRPTAMADASTNATNFFFIFLPPDFCYLLTDSYLCQTPLREM